MAALIISVVAQAPTTGGSSSTESPSSHQDRFNIYLPRLQTPSPRSRVLHNNSLQPLGLAILDIHRLHVTVQLLLGTLLVVALPRDADAQSEGDAFDAAFPDALVELRVEAHVVGAHGERGEFADLFDGAGGALFEGYAECLLGRKREGC